ncbi:hypothetical protein HanPSC8_Chr06g0238041 [Helianthus annuus]|nr:hypothetical protein HanPSC8_Chr06g0238041 [Helianthus annuus]
MLSRIYLSICLSMCICLNSTHCMGIYTQPMMSGPKDPIDGPKDHLSMTKHSKDQQGPRKITFRDLSFETYLSMRSKDPHYPSISYPSTQNIFQHFTNCCPSQTGGWLTWSTYNTNHDIVYIVTEYRQSTDTSAPTNSPLAVALSLSSIVVDSSRTSMVFGLRVLKTLMSFQVFKVGGSSKSSRLESRECINKLPVSCRKCVDKLPLNISSPLSHARE